MNLAYWQDRFAALTQKSGEALPEWLRSLRADAMALFEAQGIPTTRMEAWRYTNLDELRKIEFETVDEGRDLPQKADDEIRQTAENARLDRVAARLVFVDGRLEAGLSSSSELAIQGLSALGRSELDALQGRIGALAESKRHAFAAQNTALLEDGAVVRLAKGQTVEQPIHLVFLTSPRANRAQHPRVFIEMSPGSRAQIVQEHLGPGGDRGFTNAVTEIDVQEDASLEFLLVQREPKTQFHVSNTSARLARDARLATHTVTLGGRLVRNDLAIRLAGEGSEATMNGLFVAGSDRLIDNHTEVDHATPHGTSRELYKGILGAQARGVFRGRVIVAPDAQKTDARQQNPNLLLGPGAEIDSRPQLEIHANDVRCSHGTSIGRIEEEPLFYLRSRGIEREEALALLTQGFANEILEALPVRELEATLTDEIRARLLAQGGLA